MKVKYFFFISFIICLINFNSQVFSQNIVNTLGTSGIFKIKDMSSEFLTLSQSTGQLNILKSVRFEITTDSSTGVIYKGTERFMHSFGSNNLFTGINSGNFNSNIGRDNTAYGNNTLSNLTIGRYNTAVGDNAMYFNTTGEQNTAIGLSTLYRNTTGMQNTALGNQSLSFNTTGSDNTALGYSCLLFNTTGYRNIAVGTGALLHNSTGIENIAVGNASLISNSTGYENTAVGIESLNSNTTGIQNSAFGRSALSSNTEGLYNTAVGYCSLFRNKNGDHNVGIGKYALYNNTSGSYNIAIGYDALYNCSSGLRNIALGINALYNLSTGSFNTSLGFSSGNTVNTGQNLTLLGFGAEPSSGSVSNQITLGNGSINSLRCNVQTITSLSDSRDKRNIKDLPLGIDFIMKVKPRIFNWDKREWYENNTSDGSKMVETCTAGFIAQELDEVQTTENADWLNLVLKDNSEKLEATYGNLLPVMVKAIQELKEENDKLKNENYQTQLEIESLKKMMKEEISKEVRAVLEKIKPGISTLKISENK